MLHLLQMKLSMLGKENELQILDLMWDLCEKGERSEEREDIAFLTDL